MSPSTPSGFGPPLVGQTEKALSAILARELQGTGVSEDGWVLLQLTAVGGGSLRRQELVEQAGTISKLDPATVEAEVGALEAAGYLATDGAVALTAAAHDLQASVRSALTEITARLWGDLPEADLGTAAGVLGTVLSRANAELGYSS